jgi:hypothetical protein
MESIAPRNPFITKRVANKADDSALDGPLTPHQSTAKRFSAAKLPKYFWPLTVTYV